MGLSRLLAVAFYCLSRSRSVHVTRFKTALLNKLQIFRAYNLMHLTCAYTYKTIITIKIVNVPPTPNVPLWSFSPTSPHLLPRQEMICILSIYITSHFLEFLYTRNYIMCTFWGRGDSGFFYSAWLFWDSFILHVTIFLSVLLPSNTLLCGHATVCSPIHLLRGFCVVSSPAPWHRSCCMLRAPWTSLHGHRFLWGTHQGATWLSPQTGLSQHF